ncbi:MAG: hypothetical protein ABSH16_05520 [Sedimentisphaerales bacterium]
MKIVAMDLGKSKTVVCIYDQKSGRHKYQTIKTGPQQIHDLIMEQEPGRVVFEICSAAGWVYDIVVAATTVWILRFRRQIPTGRRGDGRTSGVRTTGKTH